VYRRLGQESSGGASGKIAAQANKMGMHLSERWMRGQKYSGRSRYLLG